MSALGRVRWETRLATNDNDAGPALPPIINGNIGYFAQDNAVHALDLSDGRPIWSWTSSGDLVDGFWLSGGLIAALTDQVSTHAMLTGLDARTGAVRWQLHIPGHGLVGFQAATSDGALAWTLTRSEDLQVVELADGKILWTRQIPQQSSPVAIDGLVVSAQNGTMTAFDDRTGERRWSLTGIPTQAAVEVEDGLILVTTGTEGPEFPAGLTAVNPQTGRVAWEFDPRPSTAYGSPGEVNVLTAGPAGLVVAVFVPRVTYLLDPRTGRLLWSKTIYLGDTGPAVLDHELVSVEGGAADTPALSLIGRRASDGQALWTDPLTNGAPSGGTVISSGSSVVITASGSHPNQGNWLLAFDTTSGRPLWRVALPTFVATSPVAVSGGLLVQPADPGYGCALAYWDNGR